MIEGVSKNQGLKTLEQDIDGLLYKLEEFILRKEGFSPDFNEFMEGFEGKKQDNPHIEDTPEIKVKKLRNSLILKVLE